MPYTQAAVERAVKVREVLMQALTGRQPWIHVAEVLGVSARTVRRLRLRYEQRRFDGLYLLLIDPVGSRRPPQVFVMQPTDAWHLHHPALTRWLPAPRLRRVRRQR
jgi:hypothetical protein